MRYIILIIIASFLISGCQNKPDESELKHKAAILKQANELKDLGKDQSNTDSAIYYYHKSLQLFSAISDTANMAKVCYNIGARFSNKNTYDSTLFYYKKALVYKIKVGANASNIYKGIGQVHDNYGNFQFALKYYFDVLNTIDSINYPTEKFKVYNDIGLVYNKLKKNDSSLYYLRKAMSGFLDTINLATVYETTGMTFDSLQNTDSALFYHRKSLYLLKYKRDINLISYSMTSLAKFFIKQSNKDSASYYKNKIVGIENYVTNKEYSSEILHMYAAYYELMGDVPKALAYNKKYYQSWLELYNQNRTIGYTIMQAELGLAESEQHRIQTELSTEAKIEQGRLSRNIVISIVVSFSIIIILILYILYKRRSQKQKRRYEIEKKEITERTIFESEEKAKFDLSDYIHTTLAGDVRNVSEIIKESPIEEQSKVNILTRTSEILKKVRSISHELGPGSLKTGGLKDGLFDMCAEIQDIYKIRVNYVCKVDERFEANFELKVYRIIQDLKNNILAHSKATEADFQILKSNNKLSITVEDNGIGFDSKDPKYKKGLGVRNIEAKVGNLNGNVEFSSMPGDGTCVLIEIPLPLR